MASPVPDQLTQTSSWPLQGVRFVKDFSFDLGALALLGVVLLVWFGRELSRRTKLILAVPFLLLALTSARGMPEFWAMPILEKTTRLTQEACRKDFAALVVLGGGLAGPEDLAISSQSRVRHAARWLSVLPPGKREKLKVILSAGPTLQGSQIPEAALMKEAFMAWRRDIPESNIVVEDKSLNTHDNATGVAGVLGEQGQTVALVTSWLHMPRAFASFRAQGMNVCPVPSPSVDHTSEGFLNFRNGDRTVRVLNEYAGLLGYRLMGWL
jgi:uncharacterized SAM-binding protein YcdF (DUF218 family)